ncbi:hypothetical protein SLEP1_g36981 [Rubroshorea leprosula]|uniref:Kri1-like C-terminal domain-containing protein n=1 Tax=Rubroshorea leprosula TaxID=152421 RepID=A0AAV5KT84_9ROSI|nr:hypothetical protein SLEP1_g36981 [Rubroshorea leprosula]
MGMKLFDNDDNPTDDISKIEINEEYARRFEHNKKREALQRYEELKREGRIAESTESDEESESESSSEEEEDDLNGVVGTKKKDLEFFDALIKVRSQDPRLKQKDIKLFGSDDDDDSSEQEGEQKEKKEKKAVYLKDVVAKQLIEEGPDFEEDDSDYQQKKKKKSYSEEQEEIKKAFLDAAQEVDGDGDDDEDDFLRVKKKENIDEEGKEELDDGEFAKKLEEYFGRDTEMDENQMFLKEFFMKKMWQHREKGGNDMVGDDEVDELLRDEEEIEKQEGYELEYNFRHEENAGDRIMGYSRKIEGSVRKKENARKEQRRRKEERMMIAEMERKEELKHLKNLKREEMKEKMKKVKEIAGIKEDDQCLFGMKDLEKEFDPDEYDKMMKAVFNEKYYAAEDEEFGSDEDGIEKPDFNKEDELLGLPKGWDVLESGDGFLAARERILKQKSESIGDGDAEVEEDEGQQGQEKEEEIREGDTEEGKRKRKRKMSLVQRAKQEMLEEFYKLDYEDTIGDLKTRFKYAKIKPNRFGLKIEEILMMDEKELNQYVSLKKLAPYRDKEWKVPNGKRYQFKQMTGGLKSDNQKVGKKRKGDSAEKLVSSSGEKGEEKAQFEGLNGDMSQQSKKAKKRRRQELKLSDGRLKAYGKIPSKPKKNKIKSDN